MSGECEFYPLVCDGTPVTPGRQIQTWFASGPNLKKMFREEPGLEERIGVATILFEATESGNGSFVLDPRLPRLNVLDPRDQALMTFMGLIMNPFWERLGGPCPRCDRYYLKASKRKKVYCSRICGSRTTAPPIIRAKREQAQVLKRQMAQEWIDKWSLTKPRSEWKPWVAEKSDIDLKWLTRAVNQGRLIAPS